MIPMSFAMELCHERRAMNDRIRTGREASPEPREPGAEEHVDVQPVRLKADVHVRWSRFEAPLRPPSQPGGPGIDLEGDVLNGRGAAITGRQCLSGREDHGRSLSGMAQRLTELTLPVSWPLNAWNMASMFATSIFR